MADQPEARCYRCGGEMQSGFANAIGLDMPMSTKPRLVFVVAGEPTAANPLAAFKQGLQEIPGNEVYLLRGRRCTGCGLVELEATEAVT